MADERHGKRLRYIRSGRAEHTHLQQNQPQRRYSKPLGRRYALAADPLVVVGVAAVITGVFFGLTYYKTGSWSRAAACGLWFSVNIFIGARLIGQMALYDSSEDGVGGVFHGMLGLRGSIEICYGFFSEATP